jgi:hypothetical protein
MQIGKGDDLTTLQTPTEALADLDRSIVSAIEELAKLGIRMLSPETDQSGIALQLRNASQTAQLGSLNAKISVIMTQIIAMMLNWRYGTDYDAEDIDFSLSDDFSQTPMGEGWVRLATEWYEASLIPRTLWLMILKQNDIVPPEYDDIEGQAEIAVADEFASYSDTVEEPPV